MNTLAISLNDNFILLGIIIVAFLILALTGWILVTNKRRKEEILPKKKTETIEEIMNEPKPLDEEKNTIQSLLDEMAKDLQKKEENDVDSFEKEQEEKAIISYQELLKAKKPIPNNIDVLKPISDLEPNNVEILDIKEDDTNPIIDEVEINKEPIEEVMRSESPLEDTKKFRTTEFISPVFGRNDTNVEYRTVDRSKMLERLTSREDHPVVKPKLEHPNIPTTPYVEPKPPVVESITPIVESKPMSRLSRLDKPEVDEILDVNELETTIKEVAKKEEVKNDNDFLKALKAFRKNLE